MASAPNVVALIVVTVDKQRHAVAASQQFIGSGTSNASLNVADIHNQAVVVVLNGSHGSTVSAVASQAVDVHCGISAAFQDSAVHAHADSAIFVIHVQVFDNHWNAFTDMELLGYIVDILVSRQSTSTDAGLNAQSFSDDVIRATGQNRSDSAGAVLNIRIAAQRSDGCAGAA